MLGKIWGLVLLCFGIYVAYAIAVLPEFNSTSSSKKTTAQKSVGSPAAHSAAQTIPDTIAATESDQEQGAGDRVMPDENSPNPLVAESPKADEEDAMDASHHFIPKSEKEIAESVAEVCEQMEAELKGAKLSPLFAKIRLKFHEERLKTARMQSLLKSCFRQADAADANPEIEIFSSEFAGQARDQIQLQVSVYDKAFKNKSYEVGRRFELVKIALGRPAELEPDEEEDAN